MPSSLQPQISHHWLRHGSGLATWGVSMACPLKTQSRTLKCGLHWKKHAASPSFGLPAFILLSTWSVCSKMGSSCVAPKKHSSALDTIHVASTREVRLDFPRWLKKLLGIWWVPSGKHTKRSKSYWTWSVEIVDFPLQNSDPTGFVVEWRLSDVRHFWCPAILTSDLAMRLVGSSACFDHVGPAQTATYGFVWNGPSPIPMDDHHLHDFFPHILLPCGAKKKRSRPLSKNTAISYLRLKCFEIVPTKWDLGPTWHTHVSGFSGPAMVHLRVWYGQNLVKSGEHFRSNLPSVSSNMAGKYINRPSVELVAARMF